MFVNNQENIMTKTILIICTSIISFCTSANAQIKKANDPVYTNLDQSVKPGDDFFLYANGGWLKRNPIPAAYASWGIGNVVSEDLRDRLKRINENAMKANAAKGSNTQKIGDFYYSGLDSVSIEKMGIAAIKQPLDKIDAIKTKQDVVNTSAYLTTIGVRNIIGAGIGQDAKNSVKMVLQLRQAGLGLPNLDYILKQMQEQQK
ncbi:MAG: hypothetical protein NVS3B8_17870 [Chitinophagaceae bacterium]